jgi:hypothetical protein
MATVYPEHKITPEEGNPPQRILRRGNDVSNDE